MDDDETEGVMATSRGRKGRKATLNRMAASTQALIESLDDALAIDPTNIQLLEKRVRLTGLVLRALRQRAEEGKKQARRGW
jgi:hypothetical protein